MGRWYAITVEFLFNKLDSSLKKIRKIKVLLKIKYNNGFSFYYLFLQYEIYENNMYIYPIIIKKIVKCVLWFTLRKCFHSVFHFLKLMNGHQWILLASIIKMLLFY